MSFRTSRPSISLRRSRSTSSRARKCESDSGRSSSSRSRTIWTISLCDNASVALEPDIDVPAELCRQPPHRVADATAVLLGGEAGNFGPPITSSSFAGDMPSPSNRSSRRRLLCWPPLDGGQHRGLGVFEASVGIVGAEETDCALDCSQPRLLGVAGVIAQMALRCAS